jgi:hypothetical protein
VFYHLDKPIELLGAVGRERGYKEFELHNNFD